MAASALGESHDNIHFGECMHVSVCIYVWIGVCFANKALFFPHQNTHEHTYSDGEQMFCFDWNVIQSAATILSNDQNEQLNKNVGVHFGTIGQWQKFN